MATSAGVSSRKPAGAIHQWRDSGKSRCCGRRTGVYRKMVHILSICMYLQYLYLLICIDMYWNYRLCWYVFVFTDLYWIYLYVMIRIVSIDRCLPLCACISIYLYVLNWIGIEKMVLCLFVYICMYWSVLTCIGIMICFMCTGLYLHVFGM